jgi:hypothetical protein
MHSFSEAWRDIWYLKTTEETNVTSYIAGKTIYDYEDCFLYIYLYLFWSIYFDYKIKLP